MPEIMCYCTVFALFYFDDFKGNFQVQTPGDLCLEGQFNGEFLHCKFGKRLILHAF